VAVIFGFCPECGAVIHEDSSGHWPDCAILTAIAKQIIESIGDIVPVPTDTAFDWSSITGQAVDRLRAKKVQPVPDHVVGLAQSSYNGRVNPADPDGELLHVIRHEFSHDEQGEARAVALGKLLRRAGEFTTPMTSVTVVIDPDFVSGKTPESERKPWVIAWRAGERKGRK
jgi:hypothetical protein